MLRPELRWAAFRCDAAFRSGAPVGGIPSRCGVLIRRIGTPRRLGLVAVVIRQCVTRAQEFTEHFGDLGVIDWIAGLVNQQILL